MREGGATSRRSTYSTHVSTLVVCHYIFKSRDRWVGEMERQRECVWGMRDEREKE